MTQSLLREPEMYEQKIVEEKKKPHESEMELYGLSAARKGGVLFWRGIMFGRSLIIDP